MDFFIVSFYARVTQKGPQNIVSHNKTMGVGGGVEAHRQLQINYANVVVDIGLERGVSRLVKRAKHKGFREHHADQSKKSVSLSRKITAQRVYAERVVWPTHALSWGCQNLRVLKR
jgi:hypothetical protein